MNGHRFNSFIGENLSICAYTPRDIAGVIFGLTNILFWLFAQAPQLVENYRNKTAESLSWLFLFIWLVGDIANFLGCIYTNQTRVQFFTAVYFLIMDLLVLLQWVYYTRINAAKAVIDDKDPINTDDSALTPPASPTNPHLPLLTASASDSSAPVSPRPTSYNSTIDSATADVETGRAPRLYVLGALLPLLALPLFADAAPGTDTVAALLTSAAPLARLVASPLATASLPECDSTAAVSHSAYVVGVVCAWVSATMYLYARIPQIIHNHRRKSTEGLSLGLFLSSTLANFFYVFAVFLPDTSVLSGSNFWLTTFAYLLGCIFTNVLSIIILVQMWIYRHNTAPVDAADDAASLKASSSINDN